MITTCNHGPRESGHGSQEAARWGASARERTYQVRSERFHCQQSQRTVAGIAVHEAGLDLAGQPRHPGREQDGSGTKTATQQEDRTMPIINASSLGTGDLRGVDYGATISLIL